jgi:hypothetical protein
MACSESWSSLLPFLNECICSLLDDLLDLFCIDQMLATMRLQSAA